MTVITNPVVGKDQRVVLMLNETTDVNPAAFSYVAEPRETDTDTLEFPISEVTAGNYFVHVQIDGAMSVYLVENDEYTVLEVNIT